jgi:regulator of CtrA degradation
MALPADINPRIVDSLYCDALLLADELRARFGGDFSIGDDCAERVALSCEGLRATTRTMHCLAWLLNHRAYFAGEISEFQLRRHGRLPAPSPSGDLALIPDDAARLVRMSERLFTRIERLETAWRRGAALPEPPSAIDRLRQRLAGAR